MEPLAHSAYNTFRKSSIPLSREHKMQLSLIVAVSMMSQMLAATPYIDSRSYPQVLQYDLDTDNMPNSYKFHYDTIDGSSRTEEGAIQNIGTADAAMAVQGAVRWYDDKGRLYEMTYKAGKRGYRTIIKQIS